MSGTRPERLTYTGTGREWFPGVPVRDLEADDIAALSEEQVAEITTPNPDTGRALYEAARAAAPKAEKTGKEG